MSQPYIVGRSIRQLERELRRTRRVLRIVSWACIAAALFIALTIVWP